MDTSNVKYGGFLIIPLKYEKNAFSLDTLKKRCPQIVLSTMDIQENVKAMLNTDGIASIGSVHGVPQKLILDAVPSGGQITGFAVADDQGNVYPFQPMDSILYVFRTEVAFLCLKLSFAQIQALNTICCPGFAQSTATYYWMDGQGQKHPFDMEQWLADICSALCLKRFFEGTARLLLEAYTYCVAVFPQVFKCLEDMQSLTFHLHQMIPLETETGDYSEEDVRFVYAVKNAQKQGYRWGCCITSQTCSYVTANAELDLLSELDAHASDGLPIVVLALYEKFTCLRFSQKLAENSKKKDSLHTLKKQMLEFRSYGTVSPANLSRWHNVKQIYAAVLELNDVGAAVEDVSTKLAIVTEHQQELIRSRNETIINMVTIFGVVSIVASVLSIVQILSDGNPVFWVSTILTSLAMTVMLLVTMHLRR